MLAKLSQMAAFSSNYEMVVLSGILSMGLQSPMFNSALASRYTTWSLLSCHVSSSMDFPTEQFRTSTGAHACAGIAGLSTSAQLVDARLEAVSERRATDIQRSARSRTSVHRDLCHWCHEIHLQDLPHLARAGVLDGHEQFLLEFELVSCHGRPHLGSFTISITNSSRNRLSLNLRTRAPHGWTSTSSSLCVDATTRRFFLLCFLFAHDGGL